MTPSSTDRHDSTPSDSIAHRRFRGAPWAAPLYWRPGQTNPDRYETLDACCEAGPTSIDEVALLDVLGCGCPLDAERTLVREVRRLPPGHELTPSGRVERRWDPPTYRPTTRPARGGRIVNEFTTLFDAAVRRGLDAAAGRPVVISLSGGLDSAAIAASLARQMPPNEILAITAGVLSGGRWDEESTVAEHVAAHLGLSWLRIDAGNDDPLAPTSPAPKWWPTPGMSDSRRRWEETVRGAVVFFGFGGDDLMRGNPSHWRDRLRRLELAAAVRDFVRTTVVHGSRPGFGLGRLFRPPTEDAPPPFYLRGAQAREVASRIDAAMPPPHFTGVDSLTTPAWDGTLHTCHALYTPALPFFDRALLEWTTTVPNAPWFLRKELLRASLRDRVPERIRNRPKVPLGQDWELPSIPATSIERAEDVLRRASMDEWIDLARWIDVARRGRCMVSQQEELARPLAVAEMLLRTDLV